MKKIVRNMPVFCSESLLLFADIENEKKPVSTIEHILSDIFHEETDYQSLLQQYDNALKGMENAYFSYASFCDMKHAIRIDETGRVLLYYYQDQLSIGIPWTYPHQITQIGTLEKTEGNEDETWGLLLKDLNTLPTLSFLLKYYLHMPQSRYCMQTVEEGYIVNDFLKIILDSHITFEWMDSQNEQMGLYIADTWWETNEQIMEDLTSMNLLEFGKKYNGFWGR